MIVLFEFYSRDDYLNSLRIATHAYDVVNEDYDYCVQRERGHEVKYCWENSIPFIAYRFVESQDEMDVLDSNFDVDAAIRTTQVVVFRKKNKDQPLVSSLWHVMERNFTEKQLTWPLHVAPELLGRNVEYVPHGDFAKRLKENALELPRFIKTATKSPLGNTLHKVIADDDLPLFNPQFDGKIFDRKHEDSQVSFLFKGELYLNPYLGEYVRSHDMCHSLIGDFILSDVLTINQDEHGRTLEYRCYVVDSKVVSISRYEDFAAPAVPTNIRLAAERMARQIKDTFGHWYVMDIADTTNGIVVLEINPPANSGAYQHNSPAALFPALREVSMAMLFDAGAEPPKVEPSRFPKPELPPIKYILGD